jgi:hypothetical protein
MGHWQADDERVNFPFYTMGRNFLETKALRPGEAYDKKMWLKLGSAKPGETVPFKMGLTPADSAQTYWSNKIIIEIDEPSSANPGENQKDNEWKGLMPPQHPPQLRIQPVRKERRPRVRWSPDQADSDN